MTIITNVQVKPKVPTVLPAAGDGLRWVAVGFDDRVYALFSSFLDCQSYVKANLSSYGAYVAELVE